MRKESTERNTAPSLHPRDPLYVRLELIFLAVFAVFAALMLVLPLHHPLELWDESSHANTALEMVMRGHWLTPTYNWKPDHWNTKPPLLIWIAVGLVRLGVRPLWAMRLPSGIAGLATVAAVYLFCRNVLRRPFVALVAALLLMGSTFFFGLHVAMSGDMDALLSLCTTLYVLAFFCFAEQTADTSPVFLIDVGYTNETGPDFDPVADFYAKAATRDGMRTVRANWPPSHAGRAWVLTCNTETAQVLQTYHVFTSFTRLPNGCIYGPSTP